MWRPPLPWSPSQPWPLPREDYIRAGDPILVGQVTVTAMVDDTDGDGEVTVLDLVLLINAFGTAEGDEGFVPRADMDDDGQISVFDVVLWITAFGNRFPQPL